MAVVIAAIVLITNFYQSKAGAAFDKRITVLETKWEIFSKMLQKDMGEILHSPHRAELDELIETNNRRKLTREEALKLAKLLDETLHDKELRPGHEVGIKLFKASIVSEYELKELTT